MTRQQKKRHRWALRFSGPVASLAFTAHVGDTRKEYECLRCGLHETHYGKSFPKGTAKDPEGYGCLERIAAQVIES